MCRTADLDQDSSVSALQGQPRFDDDGVRSPVAASKNAPECHQSSNGWKKRSRGGGGPVVSPHPLPSAERHPGALPRSILGICFLEKPTSPLSGGAGSRLAGDLDAG